MNFKRRKFLFFIYGRDIIEWIFEMIIRRHDQND